MAWVSNSLTGNLCVEIESLRPSRRRKVGSQFGNSKTEELWKEQEQEQSKLAVKGGGLTITDDRTCIRILLSV